eukprot:TRINITY_DN1077_c0_g1_i5.p1 TRINITY_DN1077_c0_g1~~TRINITY_DN1077_c0_g1_i5.p1  ORF type:complete len:427 (+),score=119.61 TRINITY_DN1077_c0_g1_i5:94-1281(+)
MAAAEVRQSIVLGGTCLPALNGQVFSLQGTTSSSEPYYLAEATGTYLYLDPSCDGSAGSRWIIDDTAPSVTAANQLNGRGQCAYFADHDTPDAESQVLALGTSIWNMNCDGVWTSLNFTISEQPQAFTVANACVRELNTEFKAAGGTASGVAYYKSEDGAYYIYQDPSCDSLADARWIIDDVEPSKTSATQLNGAGQCLYIAHQPTIAGTALQMDNLPWTMFCSSGWQNLNLAFVERTTSEASSTTTGAAADTSLTAASTTSEAAGETSSSAPNTTTGAAEETSSMASTTTAEATAETSNVASSTASVAVSSTDGVAAETGSTASSTTGAAAEANSTASGTTGAAAETSSAASEGTEGASASTSRHPNMQLSAAFAPVAGRALALWLLSAGLLVA